MTAEVLDIQDLDGVGPVTANKLREAGYDDISALAIAPIRELVEKACSRNHPDRLCYCEATLGAA